MSEKQVPPWANAAAASLLQVLRSKEPGTFVHCLRVGEFSKQLASKLGMNEYQQSVAEIAGYLHDLGEVTIDQDILAKPNANLPPREALLKHLAAHLGNEFILTHNRIVLHYLSGKVDAEIFLEFSQYPDLAVIETLQQKCVAMTSDDPYFNNIQIHRHYAPK